MLAPREVRLADGRTLAYDEVGDPRGRAVIYLHGTPDSRLARHPDDALATRAGVRLLAVDRPGYGSTSPRPAGSGPEAFAADLTALLDGRGIDRAVLLAWSGGALAGLAAAASVPLADRLSALVLVAGLVPREALEEARASPDPAARAAAIGRLGLLEMADGMAPAALAETVAPLLVPYPCDHALARDHQRELRDPADQAALARIPGALDRLADALVEAVRPGLLGVATDLADQATPLGSLLDQLRIPVALWYGEHDTVTPPSFGRWYADRLPDAQLHPVPGAGHYLPFTHWPALLAEPTL